MDVGLKNNCRPLCSRSLPRQALPQLPADEADEPAVERGLNYPRFIEYLDWLVSHGFVERTDEEGTEVYSLSPQGLDAYRRLVVSIRETMKGMRI